MVHGVYLDGPIDLAATTVFRVPVLHAIIYPTRQHTHSESVQIRICNHCATAIDHRSLCGLVPTIIGFLHEKAYRGDAGGDQLRAQGGTGIHQRVAGQGEGLT